MSPGGALCAPTPTSPRDLAAQRLPTAPLPSFSNTPAVCPLFPSVLPQSLLPATPPPPPPRLSHSPGPPFIMSASSLVPREPTEFTGIQPPDCPALRLAQQQQQQQPSWAPHSLLATSCGQPCWSSVVTRSQRDTKQCLLGLLGAQPGVYARDTRNTLVSLSATLEET